MKVTADIEVGYEGEYDQLDEWQKAATQWIVTLKYAGRSMRVPYFTGPAITEDPTAAEVLECLISDAAAADETFKDWCAEYGYDTDSRKAEKTYRQVVDQTKRLRKLLGKDYDAFMEQQYA